MTKYDHAQVMQMMQTVAAATKRVPSVAAADMARAVMDSFNATFDADPFEVVDRVVAMFEK